MCGIFGWSGKDPKDFNKLKFDLLGIMNEKRGIDSCGVTVDGEIHIGTDSNKVYRDFIANKDYPLPSKYPVVIGHTRKSTVGIKNEDNAHPFGFGNNDDGYEFIGVHNGTLLNHKTLAPDYNVELTNSSQKPMTTGKGTYLSTRTKIDSELLLECIYKSKSFKVLNEYNGAAALMFTNTNKPNELYLYHGASYYKSYTQEGVLEERPLFIWQESPTSMYVSSIKDSLIVIGGTEDTIKALPHNRVYKIVNGTIDKKQTAIVKRGEKNYQDKNSAPAPAVPYRRALPRNTHNCSIPNSRTKQSQIDFNNKSSTNSKVKIKEAFNLHSEEPAFAMTLVKEKSVFCNLRYKSRSILLNGLFIYIENYGFYKLGDNYVQAKGKYIKLINQTFIKDNFPSIDVSFERPDYIPVLHTKPNNVDVSEHIEYLYKGVHIKTPHDYYACLDMENNGNEFDYMSLSACSFHPLLDIKHASRFKEANNQLIYLNNEIYKEGTMAPLGSDRIYHIKDGNCINMSIRQDITKKSSDKMDSKKKEAKVIDINSIEDSSILKDAEKHIVNSEKNVKSKELDDYLETIFNDFENIPEQILKLKSFNAMSKAQKAIDLLEDFMSGVQELFGIEETK